MHTLSVGQKLWYVPNQRYMGDPRWVEVVSIGRKWASIKHAEQGYDSGRVDIATLRKDGGDRGFAGQCYLDKAAYEEEVRLDTTWSIFQREISRMYRVPEGITPEDIRYAATILKLAKES